MKWLRFPSKFLFIMILSAFTFASCNDDDDEDAGPSNEVCLTFTNDIGEFDFDAGCTINAVNYTWNFGNGDEISQIVPTVQYVYFEEGNYTVTLLATFQNGQTATTSQQVNVVEKCASCSCTSPEQPGGTFLLGCSTIPSVLEAFCNADCNASGFVCNCNY